MKQRLHLASCPQRRIFALASGIKTVRLWSLETRLFHMDEPPVELPYALEFDTGHTGIIGLMLLDEETLVCAHGDGCVQVWAIEPPEALEDAATELSNYEPGRHAMDVGQLVVPQSSTLTSHSSDVLGVRLLWTLDVGDRLNTCAFWHGGDHLRCALGGASGQVFWIELGRHRAPQVQKLGQVGSSIVFATISARGDRVATASRDRRIAVWRPREELKVDEATGAWRIFDDVGGEIWALAFSHSGRYLAGGAIDNGVYMWDTRAKKALRAVSHDHRGWISDLVWSEDDRLLACASWDNTVGLFRSVDLEPLYCFDYHQDYVSQVAFVPSSTLLISAGYDRRVAVWDWREATLVREYREHDDWIQALSWVGAGLFLTASADGIARVWSSNTLRCEAVLEQRRVQSWFDTGLDDSSANHSGGFRAVRPDAPIAIDATLRGALESSMAGLGDEVSLFMDEPLAPLVPQRGVPEPEPEPEPVSPPPPDQDHDDGVPGADGERGAVVAPAAGLFEIAPPSSLNDFSRGGGSGEIMAFGVISSGERLPFSVSKSGLLDLQEASLVVDVGGGKLQTTSELMFDSSASHVPDAELAPLEEPALDGPDDVKVPERDEVVERVEPMGESVDLEDSSALAVDVEAGVSEVVDDDEPVFTPEDERLDDEVPEAAGEFNLFDVSSDVSDEDVSALSSDEQGFEPDSAFDVRHSDVEGDELSAEQRAPAGAPSEPSDAVEPLAAEESGAEQLDESDVSAAQVESESGVEDSEVEEPVIERGAEEPSSDGSAAHDEPADGLAAKLSRSKIKALFRRHLSQTSASTLERDATPIARAFESPSSFAEDDAHDLSLFDDISEHIDESIAQLADPNVHPPVEEFDEDERLDVGDVLTPEVSEVASEAVEEPRGEIVVGEPPASMMAVEPSAHELETVEYTPELAPVRSDETARYVAPTRVGASDLMTELAKQTRTIQRESVASELSQSGASDDVWSELSEEFPAVVDAFAEDSFVSLSVSHDLAAESVAELEAVDPSEPLDDARGVASLGEQPSDDSELLEELSIPDDSEPLEVRPPPRPVAHDVIAPELAPSDEGVASEGDDGESELGDASSEAPGVADPAASDATAESEPAAELLAGDIARASAEQQGEPSPENFAGPVMPAAAIIDPTLDPEPAQPNRSWLDAEDRETGAPSEHATAREEDRADGARGEHVALTPGAAISSFAEESTPELDVAAMAPSNPYMQDPDSDSTPFGMIMMPAEPTPKSEPELVEFDEPSKPLSAGVGEGSSIPRVLETPTELEPPPISTKSTLMGVSPPRELVVESLRAKLRRAKARDEQEGPKSEPFDAPGAKNEVTAAEQGPRRVMFSDAVVADDELAAPEGSISQPPMPEHDEPSDPEATKVVKKPTLADLRRYASAENSVASEVSLDRASAPEPTPGKKLSQTLEQPIVFKPSRARAAEESPEPTPREGSMFKTLSGTNPRVKPIAGDHSPLPSPGREALDIATPFGLDEGISPNQTMIGGLIYQPSEPPPMVDAPSAADTDASFPEVSEVVSEPEYTEHTPALVDLKISEIWQMRLAENRPAMKIFKRRHGQPQNWRSWDSKEVGIGRVYGVSALGERNLFAVSGARRHVEIWSEKRGIIARLPSAGRAVHALCSMADGRVVVSGDDRAKLTVWLLPKALKASDESSVIRGTLEGHVAPISYVCADKNGKMLLSTSLDGTARIWSMEDGQCISVMDHRGEPLSAADFWARGFVTVSHEGNMRLWDIRGVQIDQVSANSPLTCVVSHRGKVYFGCQDGAVVEYFRGRTKTLTRHADVVTGLSLSNEGVLVSVSAAGELFIHGEDDVDTELDVGEALSGVSFGTGMIVAGTMRGDVEIFKKR